jgi:hypothetical protein
MRLTSAVLIGICSVTFLMQGCAETTPPQKTSGKPAARAVTGPPVTATAITPSGTVAFTASVVYKETGPTWAYSVASATGSPLTAIEIISPRSLKDCALKAPETHNGSTTSGGDSSDVDWKIKSTTAGNPTGFTDHGGAASVTFTITCKQQNGPTYLLVTDHAGTISDVTTSTGQNIIGPIAGPN